jgi:acetyl coenzyme A synthetase (ADP forming)-like protein
VTAAQPPDGESDIVLRDGSTVHVRPVRAGDREAILRFLQGLSGESTYLRFFSGRPDLEAAAREAAIVDDDDRFGLIATSGPSDEVEAHALYLRTGSDRAEIALAIAEPLQGRGLGTILIGQLAEVAHRHGIVLFEANVLAQNYRMLEVFRESGFPLETQREAGEVRVEFPTSFTPEALERFDRREQTAAVAAVGGLLRPRSVAVIGASRSRGTIGGEVFHNLVSSGFPGPVYPVNPTAEVVQSVTAYGSVKEIPGPVDLAVVVVPAPSVATAAEECGVKGVRSLVVISSGFAEVGSEGARRQRELVSVCRRFGMRLIGPNCMGVMNVSPAVSLNATFAPAAPPHGRVAFSSQSGALGLAVIDYASALGLGLSSFVSVGNKADISGNDLIQFWESDEDTDVILLYLESFGNPRKFARITRRVGRTKPIIAVKSGRSSAGARATSSHTGALLAASDVTVDALFRQAGVIRTDTLEELFDVAALLANQPAPRGDRVGILTNAGGLGILCADACEAGGLQVPVLPETARRRLSEFLAEEASSANPVDMIASATAEDYRRAIGILAEEGAVDALIVIFVPPLVTRTEDVARAIRQSAGELPKDLPILSVFMSARGVPDELRGEGVRVPSFAFPEGAARALVRAARYGQWRSRPEGVVPPFDHLREPDAARLVARVLAGGPRWLRPEEVAELFACYGLPLVEWRLAVTPEAAGDAAEALGGPVALKAVAPGLVHKTEAGAVRLSLTGRAAVTEAAERMAEAVEGAQGAPVEAYLVQRMVSGGVEMLIGVVHDHLFGPVIACGGGGTVVELVKDVSVRITPLSDLDAAEMLRSTATFPLLQGYRGAPPADVPALAELLLRVSAMVEAHPEIAEMDCNPVIALPRGAAIVDARVRLEAPAPPRPLGARSS